MNENNIERGFKKFDLQECLEKHGGRCVTNALWPARVVYTDRKGDLPVGVLALQPDGTEILLHYPADGRNVSGDDSYTLFLRVKTVEKYAVVERDWLPIFDSREAAENYRKVEMAGREEFTTVKLILEEPA